MPGTTEAITFTDSYKHMECLGGMMLQSFLMVTLFTRATPGTPASCLINAILKTWYIFFSTQQCDQQNLTR